MPATLLPHASLSPLVLELERVPLQGHQPPEDTQLSVPVCAVVNVMQVNDVPSTTPIVLASEKQTMFEPSIPFQDLDLTGDLSESSRALTQPAKPLLKMSSLQKTFFYFQHNGQHKVFTDMKLPPPNQSPVPDERFNSNYFITLSNIVSAPGPAWPAGTPNHKGARVKLVHTTLRMDRWRHHLLGYEDVELCQYLEYGFPLGLQDPPPTLVPCLQNHASSYQYFTWIDEFVVKCVKKCYAAGPYGIQPFPMMQISPLMTAAKKPDGRRAVFDASFGDMSLNKGTPENLYLGEPIDFVYPKIEDFRNLVLKCGSGSFMWKRDLSSFFLQIPLDPVEYPKVAFIWRSEILFFTGLMFGLRHSGYQGQRVTDAVRWVHQRLGLETDNERLYNSTNYSDDIGGVEDTLETATESANALAELLSDLGLKESTDKYHPPSTCMPYLGVQFDSIKQEMSVPPEKLAEVTAEVKKWQKKTTTTKKALQQLLGRLFWVSRCVRFSRPFMGRLLYQLKNMHHQSDYKKSPLSPESKLDIDWWHRYLSKFNGVELIYVDEPLDLTLEQLLDTTAVVNCGDAQMWGGGSYYADEYWSRPFPAWLQSPEIPIHLKEFYVVLASCWLWGDRWTGRLTYIFCDNDAVVETLDKKKPKDPKMLELLRVFLYIVCVKKFTPTFKKIGTKENSTADFISRCHDPLLTTKFFQQQNLPARKLVEVPDKFFDPNSNW